MISLKSFDNKTKLYLLGSAAGLILFLLLSLTLAFKGGLFYKLYPKPLSHASSSTDQPVSQASFILGSTVTSPVPPNATFSAQLKVRTDTDASNLFTAKITFPANLVHVQSISTTGSFITSWADTSFDNTAGTISIIGGVPNPGYKTSGSDALMATIVFTTLATPSGGSANISFNTTTSSIFRNSDNLNLLTSTTPLSVTVNPQSSPTPSPTPSASLPLLFPFCNGVQPCHPKNTRVTNMQTINGGSRTKFSPDSSRFVFDKPTASSFYQVFSASLLPANAGFNVTTNLTEGKAALPNHRNNSNGVYHPSGNFIVFKSEENSHYDLGITNINGFDFADPGYGGFSNLWAMDPSGTKFWKLTNIPIKPVNDTSNAPIYGILDPNFSPDGQILYWAESYQDPNNPYSNWKIMSATFTVDANGNPSLSNPQGNVVFDPWHGATPIVNAPRYVNVMDVIDSDRLVMVGNPTGAVNEFGMDEYILHISTGVINDLTNTPSFWEEGSDATANKRAVVYMSNKDSLYQYDQTNPNWHSQPMQREYYVVNTDGTRDERLTYFNDPTAPEYTGYNTIAIDPSLSPDGKYMLATIGVDYSDPTAARRNYRYYIVLLNLENDFPAISVVPTPTLAPTPTPLPTPTPTPTPVACSLTSATWSNLATNPVSAGTSVNLLVNSTGSCSGKTVAFNISQDNGILPALSIVTSPANATFSGNRASSNWLAEYQPDGPFGIFDPPEYFFTATLTNPGSGTNTVTSASPELQVNNIGGPSPSPSPTSTGPGDGNRDGVVNLTDLSVLLSNFLKVSTQPDFPTGLDINTDGIINSLDFTSEINLLKANGSI